MDFPVTLVAALEHDGPVWQEIATVRRFVRWRIANGLHPDRHDTYGVYYNDPGATGRLRMDICCAVHEPVASNDEGIIEKTIGGGSYATMRHTGSRRNIGTAHLLRDLWQAELRDAPVIFHYVNVGPDLDASDLVTDIYVPILPRDPTAERTL